MADLRTSLLGLALRNPILPAAGPPGRDGAALLACAAGGAGALVAKTISTRAAVPPTPNMAEIQHGMVNTELWSELPPERWIEHEYALARTAGLPLIVSLGYTPAEIAELAPRVAPFADAVELSTHYVGTDPEPMVGAIRAAKAALDVPVLVKLSPHRDDMAAAARAAADAGADGIVAINSFGPVLSIDIETATPRLGGANGYGWISGPALKPLAVRCVRDIARAVDLPIVGVGGVSTGRDAVEMLMAGATAVGVCTAAILKGPQVFGRIARELGEWLDAHGYESVANIHGAALTRAWPSGPLPAPRIKDNCNGCAVCQTACVYGAIAVTDGRAVIDDDKCTRCGLCVTRCRLDAIDWLPADAPSAPLRSMVRGRST
ncbi:MAG TPA: 4Fe-4S binding protein [Candidatus Limnocylindrales bacterium]